MLRPFASRANTLTKPYSIGAKDDHSLQNIESTLKHIQYGCYATIALLFAIVVCIAVIVKPTYDTLIETSETEAAILSIISNNSETVINIIHSVHDVVNSTRLLLPNTVSDLSAVANLLIDTLNATDDDYYEAP